MGLQLLLFTLTAAGVFTLRFNGTQPIVSHSFLNNESHVCYTDGTVSYQASGSTTYEAPWSSISGACVFPWSIDDHYFYTHARLVVNGTYILSLTVRTPIHFNVSNGGGGEGGGGGVANNKDVAIAVVMAGTVFAVGAFVALTVQLIRRHRRLSG
jgi:hypothetical protein